MLTLTLTLTLTPTGPLGLRKDPFYILVPSGQGPYTFSFCKSKSKPHRSYSTTNPFGLRGFFRGPHNLALGPPGLFQGPLSLPTKAFRIPKGCSGYAHNLPYPYPYLHPYPYPYPYPYP